MFEFKKIVTHPKLLIELHDAMLHYSALEILHLRDYEKINKIPKNKNENFTAKTQYVNLKAPSNNVKMQSDKTLATLLSPD